MVFSVTFIDTDGTYNHKVLEADNSDDVKEHMEEKGFTNIKIEERRKQ